MLDAMKSQVGDKVRVKRKAGSSVRGIIERVRRNRVVVRINDTGREAVVFPEDIINYSLAARKAWVSSPSRRVGRPKGASSVDRVSVTLRIDREVWDTFQRMEALGVIVDRTSTINSWLRTKLRQLARAKEPT